MLNPRKYCNSNIFNNTISYEAYYIHNAAYNINNASKESSISTCARISWIKYAFVANGGIEVELFQ
jgi:hypothetical protein